MQRTFSLGVIAIVVFTFSQPSFAQIADFSGGPGYSSFINTLIDNKIWEASMAHYSKKGSNRNGRAATAPRTSRTAPPEVPAYRRYPAVQFKSTGTRITLQDYLDSVQASPQDKVEIKKLVLDTLQKYEIEAAAKGYPNDWALAYVSFVGLNSHVYNGNTEKPIIPFEQNVGLRDVVAEYATGHGIFNNVTDRKKQELYELMVMLGGLTYHLYDKALKEKNAEDLKVLKLAAAQNLKMVGITP